MRLIPAVAFVVLASLVAACGRAPQRGDTQIVVQWSPPHRAPARDLMDAWSQLNTGLRYQRAETRIREAGGALYSEQGAASSGDLFNVHLGSDQVDRTVARLAFLERVRRLPRGMRIGVVIYRNAARTDWSYQAVYPPGLAYFSQSYASAAEECAMWRARKDADPNPAGPRGLDCAVGAGPALALP